MTILRRRRRPTWSPVALDGASDAGPRPDNQDRWAVDAIGWAVVCDGVGGHRGGGRAAARALEAAAVHLPADPLAAARAANDAVRAGRAADPTVAAMATTLTLAVRRGERRWEVLQVGDSPAWVIGPAGGRSVTFDHNLVGDLVRSGAITPDEALGHHGRHMITRAIGITEVVEPELFTVDLAPDEALVLASDGLSDVATPTDAAAVGADADALVALALERGTRDNVTVVVVR